MAILNQKITENYAIYNGDCMEVIPKIPDSKIHLSIYSPPFCGLYQYSSNERDMSNCESYDMFFEHYEFLVKEIFRVTLPGRCSAVHCMDIPNGNSGKDDLTDFPGDIIRLHQKHGFKYVARHAIWKEPLAVRNRTMQKNLAHKTVVDDSTFAGVAGADYLLIFRKNGVNEIPVNNSNGLLKYHGDLEMPFDIQKYYNYKGNQIENRYSHWIWRNYASSFWYDIRIDEVLSFKEAREEEDEKHIHPLQLDVINRCIQLRSNEGETVLTPFMGVGSEVYGAVLNKRKAIGIELKTSYYNQAIKNIDSIKFNDDDDKVLNGL